MDTLDTRNTTPAEGNAPAEPSSVRVSSANAIPTPPSPVCTRSLPTIPLHMALVGFPKQEVSI
jgi:hypothetical protein